MIIAVDFDGTLAITDYPRIVSPIPKTIAFCKERQAKGDTLILWTCRCGEALAEAIKWCAEQGLVFDYVNGNPPEKIDLWGETRKVFADIYLDDHNMLLSELKD